MEAVVDGQEHVVIRSSEEAFQLLNKELTTTITNMNGQWDGEDQTIGFNLKYLKAAPVEEKTSCSISQVQQAHASLKIRQTVKRIIWSCRFESIQNQPKSKIL